MGNPPGPRKTVRLLRAIGLRVLVWGGLAGLVLLWFGDLPSLVAPLVGPRPGDRRRFGLARSAAATRR